MNDTLMKLLVLGVPVIMAITLHEAAHGYAALVLGDDTAQRMGRLSINPLRHIDPVGTLLVPGFLLITHAGFLFGWAKPVPVSAWRLRDPRRGMALVAAAGPATNFVLAWLAALATHAIDGMTGDAGYVLASMAETFIVANLVLGLFNLLPIPPLDGGRIAVGLLPERWAAAWARTERVGLLLVILLVFLGPRLLAEVGVQFDPVGAALATVLPAAYDLVNRLAFVSG